jgi:hypothetical protein
MRAMCSVCGGNGKVLGHSPAGEFLEWCPCCTHVVTKANRHQARVGRQWDRIVVGVGLTEEELGILRTRLAPGGKLEFAQGVR